MSEDAVTRAVALLREVQEETGKLPAVRLFCREYGFSSRTCAAARALLAAGGQALPPRGPRALWRDVAERLRQEIAAGRWTVKEPLPSPKELGVMLKVHPVTVRRALAFLVEQGPVERQGRRWYPRHAVFPRYEERRIVLCIGGGTGATGLEMDSDREIDVWREVQAEAASEGLSLRVFPWNGDLKEVPAGTLGAVVSTWHIAEVHELLRQLVGRRLRSCIWTSSALDRSARDWRRERLLSFHDIGDALAAGRDMAQYLNAMGHRHLAWISPFHGSGWSQRRLEGLRQGFDGRIDVFTMNAVSEGDFMPEIRPTLRRWEHRFPDFGPWSLAPVHPLWEAYKAQSWARLMRSFAPELERAVRNRATVWVGASDLTAVLCRRWLAQRGLLVPRDLSLCGFDDISLAMREDLTSYHFDASAVARAMIRRLIEPRSAAARLTTHPGRVIARGSTPALHGASAAD